MVEQPAFASRDTTLLHLASEPVVVVYRGRQKVQGNLIDAASGLRGQAGQLRFEFGWNLKVHEASVGGIEGSVNRVLKNLVSAEGIEPST